MKLSSLPYLARHEWPHLGWLIYANPDVAGYSVRVSPPGSRIGYRAGNAPTLSAAEQAGRAMVEHRRRVTLTALGLDDVTREETLATLMAVGQIAGAV